MNEEINASVPDRDEGDRPPVDPKNKLYTVISLLIFAVLYAGWYFIKDNFTLTYALYADSMSAEQLSLIERELEADIPEGAELEYARLHRNFDSDMLYASFRLPQDITDDENFADSLIPYRYGDVDADRQFTVYPDADMTVDYVYGDNYVCVDDPMKSCLIYEDNGETYALFRTNKYDSSVIKEAFGDAVKIPLK